MSVMDFARQVLHGDSEHRAWLLEAAHAYSHGNPLPKPRGGSGKDRRISELETEVARWKADAVSLTSQLQCAGRRFEHEAAAHEETERQLAEARAALTDVVGMIADCADAPKNPDSLTQMVLVRARAVLAQTGEGRQ